MSYKQVKASEGELFVIMNEDGTDFETDDGKLHTFYSYQEAEDFIRSQDPQDGKLGYMKYKLVALFEPL
jgi:hypothetical protein